MKTCFLIDDDEDDRDIFQLALAQLDTKFNFVTCDNSLEAIETLRKGVIHPDYIFLDLNMPIVSGRQCLIEIRKLKNFAKTPVLVYTTSSILSDKEGVMRLGATSFITKPNTVSILVTVLKKILSPSTDD